MRARLIFTLVLLALLAGLAPAVQAAPAAQASAAPRVAFSPIGTYATGTFAEGGAEIAAYDSIGKLLFVVNGASDAIDVVSIANPAAPSLVTTIDITPYGAGLTSVDFFGGAIAVAIEPANPTDPGSVVFFDRAGRFINQVTVGVLPDMVTFTPNGRWVLTANEGQPSDDYAIDPEGSISVIDTLRGVRRLTQADVTTVSFSEFNVGGPRHAELPAGVRIFGPNATVAQDLEPEYITVDGNSLFAYVTLQENNALAVINIPTGRVVRIMALGLKDHNLPGNGLDASDRDSRVNIANWPVYGMYQPDGIASVRINGQTYLVTANEGDARDYDAFEEELRVGSSSYRLDPTAFPNAATLKRNENLGRLTVSRATGDLDGDGDYDQIHVFGSRSFTIWTGAGDLVFDSGDQLERITAAVDPANFNANNDANSSFDNRSDNKGPEPEGLALGAINGRIYAFVGLERIGGVMIYDITNPNAPEFVQWANNRDFYGDARAGTAGDLGPEGVLFVPAQRSPNGRDLLITANEVSGTVTIYATIDPDGAGTLTLLHNNDGESSLLPLSNPVTLPNGSAAQLPVGGAAAYKTLTVQQLRAAWARGHAVLNVYAGDSFLASATLACSLPPAPAGTPIYDAVAQRQMPYDAHILGNHEFDFGPDFLERFIRSFAVNGVLAQPFLSANLDFSAEPGFANLLDADGLLVGYTTDGRVIAGSAIVVDERTGQRFGIVSATTPLLPTISSPRNVRVTSADIPSTAGIVQTEIDRLTSQYGVRKIIFVSHLQDASNDRQLIRLLRGVDIAVAGGGDELLTNPAIPASAQLLPGELAPVAGTYPLTETDAAGRTVYIVTTAGNYKYLGQIEAVFNAAGEITSINNQTSYPRRVIPTSSVATQLGLADAVAPDAGIVATVDTPVQACLAAYAQPIAATEVPLDVSRAGSRGRETNAGNTITDGFLASYDRYGPANGLPPRGPGNPVIAVQNGGGIRQNAGDILPVGGVVPGTISRQNTLDVLAFLTNTVTVVRNVTPQDLKDILERSAASLPGQGGQFLQIAGFRVTIDTRRTAQTIASDGTVTRPGDRIVSVTLNDGTPIIVTDPATGSGVVAPGAPAVTLVTNSFTADGGDNYPWLKANPNKVQLPATYEQAWVEYLLSFPAGFQGLPTIPASDARYAPGGEGRITIIR